MKGRVAERCPRCGRYELAACATYQGSRVHAADIEAPQTSAEQVKKSRGDKHQAGGHSAAETHAAVRLAGGFSLDQMVSEYRALRASVIKLWQRQLTDPVSVDISDLTRFNESLDQALTESIEHYSLNLSVEGFVRMHLKPRRGNSRRLTVRGSLTHRRLHERQQCWFEIICRASRATETWRISSTDPPRLGSFCLLAENNDMASSPSGGDRASIPPRREFNVKCQALSKSLDRALEQLYQICWACVRNGSRTRISRYGGGVAEEGIYRAE